MSFDAGSLVATIQLDGAQAFAQELDAVGQKFKSTDSLATKAGSAVSSGMKGAAVATAAVTTAAGAYVTMLMKTGVSYNTLQQTSRAALKTILGGAEQANAQMDKLDAFAKNSPFSKDVFIKAQQQLLGFGVEAKKVVPILDAVQQATAAVGGSNQDIAEIVDVLAKVQSSGKLTAVTFNQLGARGIDAAKLIGQGMNMTAAEVRDSVTKGTLDAGEALDTLTDQMQKTFGGAADNVKQTFAGTRDRIKAASRDIGAALAEPFVSKNGGGMAVTWGNQVADVMRAAEKHVSPVVNLITNRLMPSFAEMTRMLDSAKMAVQRFDIGALEQNAGKLAQHAPGLAAASAAFFAMGTNIGPLRALGLSVNPIVAGIVGLVAASPALRDGLGEVAAAASPLLDLTMDLAKTFSGALNAALPIAADGLSLVAAVAEPLVDIITAIPAPVIAAGVGFMGLYGAMKRFGPATEVASKFLGDLFKTVRYSSGLAAFEAGLGATGAAVATMGSAAEFAERKTVALGAAMKSAFLANPVGLALTVVAGAVAVWAAVNANAQQAVKEHDESVAALQDTLNQTTGATTAATKEIVSKNIAERDSEETLKRLGLSNEVVAEAVLGGASAYEALIARVKEKQAAERDEMKAGSDKHELTQQQIRDSILLGSYIEEEQALVNAAAEATRAKVQADREAAAALTDVERSNHRFNDALKVATDATATAEDRVRALRQALDELKGGSLSAEEAEIRLAETTLNLAEGFARTNEAGEKLWQGTLDGAGKIDTSTRTGIEFAKAMGSANDAMLLAADSAYQQAIATGDVEGAQAAAKAAGEGYINNLREQMLAAGLTDAQVKGLTDTYFAVPSVVATLLTDNGSIGSVNQAVINLSAQILATPDKVVTITEPMSAAVRARLIELGYTVTNLPDGTIEVRATGVEQAEYAINEAARARETTISIREILYKSTAPPPGIAKGAENGNLFTGGVAQAFENGGFATGFYKAQPKGKALFKFAEDNVNWEAFISGKSGQEERNAKIAMAALRRLGREVVPIEQARAMRGFENGGTVGRVSSSAAMPVVRDQRSGRAITVNVGGVTLGKGAGRSEFDNFMTKLTSALEGRRYG